MYEPFMPPVSQVQRRKCVGVTRLGNGSLTVYMHMRGWFSLANLRQALVNHRTAPCMVRRVNAWRTALFLCECWGAAVALARIASKARPPPPMFLVPSALLLSTTLADPGWSHNKLQWISQRTSQHPDKTNRCFRTSFFLCSCQASADAGGPEPITDAFGWAVIFIGWALLLGATRWRQARAARAARAAEAEAMHAIDRKMSGRGGSKVTPLPQLENGGDGDSAGKKTR